MTDRELLEFAAKAADVFLTPEKLADVFPEWDWCETDEPYFKDGGSMVGTVVWYGSDGVELGGTEKLEWDPLNDDGDALLLAVKLHMAISIHDNHCTACAQTGCMRTVQDIPTAAATRRAIVLAAAAIGKEMQ